MKPGLNIEKILPMSASVFFLDETQHQRVAHAFHLNVLRGV